MLCQCIGDGREQIDLVFHALCEGGLNLSYSGVNVSHSAVNVVDLPDQRLDR